MPASKSDILALARSGFTAKQIATILNEDVTENQPDHVLMPDVKKAAEIMKENAPVPAAAGAAVPDPVADNDNGTVNVGKNLVDAMNAKFDQMIQLMQMQNVSNSQMPQKQSVEDILGSIINPPGMENE